MPEITLTAAPILIPTGDPTPVEKAAADSITAMADPETFLWIVFHRSDGSAHISYAWTAGGPDLGNRTDRHALTAGLDCADWLHITSQHRRDSTRGRIEIQAYALRPVLAAVLAGGRAPEMLRHQLGRMATPLPRWIGVGPDLVGREARRG